MTANMTADSAMWNLGYFVLSAVLVTFASHVSNLCPSADQLIVGYICHPAGAVVAHTMVRAFCIFSSTRHNLAKCALPNLQMLMNAGAKAQEISFQEFKTQLLGRGQVSRPSSSFRRLTVHCPCVSQLHLLSR
jgi:hypothetical protein